MEFSWSKSRLKTFRNCSLLYKYIYIDNLKPEVKEVTNKGIILHEFFDRFYQNWTGDITETIKKTKEQMNLDDDWCVKYSLHFQSFIDFNKKKLIKYPDEFMPLFTEKKYKNEWTGAVDRVEKVGDKIIVIDYKTTEGYSIDNYIDELCLYAKLVEENENIKPTHVGIFFTQNNNLIIKKLDTGEVEEMFQGLETEKKLYEAQIEKNVFTANKGYWCSWCGYKKICPLFGGEKK